MIERGDFVPQEEENWNPEAVWKHLRYRIDGALARRARPRVPAVHALLRRRQHEVLGQRAVPAASRGFRGGRSTSTASRRPGRSTTTTLEPYYERAERLYHVRGQHGVDPTEPPRGPFPYDAGSARATRWSDIVDAAAHVGPASRRRCRSGCSGQAKPTAACSATPATRFRARSTRRATPKSAASATRLTRPNVTLWTNALRATADHRRLRPQSRRPLKWSGTARRSRRRAGRHRLVRRGEFGGVAAPVGERRASRRPGEFVRARRHAATWRTSRR